MKKYLCLAIAGLLGAAALVAAETVAELPCRWERFNIDGGGYFGRIVIDPNNPKRVFCLSDKGGIHRSDNGGDTWVMKNRGFTRELHYGVSDLVIDPKNPNRLVAAVGNAPWAWKFHFPGAVMVSDDGGDTWTQKKILGFPGEGSPGKGWGNRLNFASDGTLYAATFHQGLWKSPDSGENWEYVGLKDKFLTNVLIDPDDAKRLLVSAWELPQDASRKGGLYESRDGGRSWKELLKQNIVNLDRAPYRADWLLANCGGEGIFFSKDRGETWQKLPSASGSFRNPSSLGPKGDALNYNKVKFQPGREPRIWAAAGGEGAPLFYTDDFGKTWIRPVTDFRQSLRYPKDWYVSARKWAPFTSISSPYEIAFDPVNPERMFVTDWYTVWRSDDGGKHFTSRPHGLNIVCIYQVIVDPSNPKTVYVTAADVGLFKSIDGGKTLIWPFKDDTTKKTGDILINPPGGLVIAKNNPQKLAATVTIVWKKPSLKLFCVSRDGGRHWQIKTNGLPQRGGYLTSLVSLSRDNSEFLVANGGDANTLGNVYYTRNGGDDWEIFAPGLPQAPLFGNNWNTKPNLTTDGVNVYAATDHGVYHCLLKEKQWRKLEDKVLADPRMLRTLEALPEAPGMLWAGTGNGLFVSRDAGKSFQKASVPGMDMCQGIAVDPADSNRWFVAVAAPWYASHTNVPGVYLTEDGGKTYRRLSDMPGEGMEWRLTLDPKDRNCLYVGTNGIGVWKGQILTEKPNPEKVQ